MSDRINLNVLRKRAREDDDDDDGLYTIISSFIIIVAAASHHVNYRGKKIAWDEQERVEKRKHWMDSLMNDRICREQLRMDRRCFDKFCHILQTKGGVGDH